MRRILGALRRGSRARAHADDLWVRAVGTYKSDEGGCIDFANAVVEKGATAIHP